MGDDRSHAGELQGRARLVSRKHVVRAAFVGGLAMTHGSADRDFVGDFCRFLEIFTETFARNLCWNAFEGTSVLQGCVRLGIPRLLMGHAARKEDVNYGFGHSLLRLVELLGSVSLHSQKLG